MGWAGLRILVLTFYYRPDLSAGSFRVTPFVAALRAAMPKDAHIDVVTTLPNRYQSFTAQAPPREEEDGISIHRIALGRHRSGILDQSAAFFGFVRGALAITKGREYDLVFATSSRLMTAVLAAWIARRKRANLYLDIRDIFADTIIHVVPPVISAAAGPLFSALERFAVRRAGRVNVVSAGFLEYFLRRYPRQRFSCIPNGVDDEFVRAGPVGRSASPRSAGADTLTVLYAGNIGEGQGLHLVVPRLAATLGRRVRFKVIGDGGRQRALEAAVGAMRVSNVELIPPVNREELIEEYRAADVLFLHLNDYAAFDKVLPSKVFEYAAMGKPVWAGVSGFAAEFIRSEIPNAAVFRPCDVHGAVRSLGDLVLEDAPRTTFIEKYSRAAVSRRLAEDVLSLAAATPAW